MSAVCTVFLAGSLEAEPQYPDVFFMLPGERTEMEVGNGRGRRRGGLQSDRLTERSDNERLGLSGAQTASPSAIAARGWESQQGERRLKGGGESALSAG